MGEIVSFDQELGLVLSGIMIGGILGAVYGYSHDDVRKGKTIWAFVAILIASIGGGLYFFSINGQIAVFNIFTFSYGGSFGIIGLISKKIHHRYHGYGSGESKIV